MGFKTHAPTDAELNGHPDPDYDPEAEAEAQALDAYFDGLLAFYDDDPNPYHGDYSEM